LIIRPFFSLFTDRKIAKIEEVKEEKMKWRKEAKLKAFPNLRLTN
jgi:hypothetical protein